MAAMSRFGCHRRPSKGHRRKTGGTILAPAQSACTMAWRFFTTDKYHVIQIFAVTRLQWFSFDQLKRSSSVGLPFSPQEDGVCHFLVHIAPCGRTLGTSTFASRAGSLCG